MNSALSKQNSFILLCVVFSSIFGKTTSKRVFVCLFGGIKKMWMGKGPDQNKLLLNTFQGPWLRNEKLTYQNKLLPGGKNRGKDSKSVLSSILGSPMTVGTDSWQFRASYQASGHKNHLLTSEGIMRRQGETLRRSAPHLQALNL